MKKSILGFLACMTILFTPSRLSSQCEIWDMVYDISECEHGEFFVVLDFEHANTSDSFEIRGNGQNYGTFAYTELPVRIGSLEGDCHTPYEFVASDKNHPDCSDFVEVGEVCCNCRIYELVVEASECREGLFFVEIDFLHENTGDEFTIMGNGVSYGTFSYSQLPVIIDGLEGDCETPYEFVVADVNNPDCRASAALGEVCCEEECRIYELTFDVLECNGDSCVRVRLDFLHEGTGGVGFDVFDRHGMIGFYSYSQLPLIIDCYPISGLDYEFVRICDNDDPHCCAEAEAPALECDTSCAIRELVVDVVECDTNQTFFVRVDFDYDNVSDTGFVLKVDGDVYDQYKYDSLPILAGPFNGGCDREYIVAVCDLVDVHCTDSVIVDQPCCEDECDIRELVFEIIECNGDSCIRVRIDFVHEGTGDEFTVSDRHGLIGTFSYNNLPLVIDCYPISGLDYEFVRICDVAHPDCCAAAEAAAIDCGEERCEIGHLILEPTECDDHDRFYVDLDFEHARTTDSFKVVVNGHELGKYAYGDLPVRLGPFEGDCETVREFLVMDCERECASDGRLEEICCEEECDIRELVFEIIECNGDSCIRVRIDFVHEGTGDEFTVSDRHGHIGTYSYNSLPLVIDCYPISGLDFEFVRICDVAHPDCCAAAEVAAIDCGEERCEIGHLILEPTECDDHDMFYVELDFEHAHTTDSFKVVVNGHELGKYAYGDLPVRLGPFEGDCETVREFLVMDCERECASDGRLEEICCEEECRIWDLNFYLLECNGDSCVKVLIDFMHEGTGGVGFDVFDRNGRVGFYSYDDLPLIIDCYPISGRDYEFVRVCDNDSHDCCASAEREALDCTTAVGDLTDSGWNIWYDIQNQALHFDDLGPGADRLKYRLFSLDGTVISTSELSEQAMVGLSEMKSGIYLLYAETANATGYLKVIIP